MQTIKCRFDMGLPIQRHHFKVSLYYSIRGADNTNLVALRFPMRRHGRIEYQLHARAVTDTIKQMHVSRNHVDIQRITITPCAIQYTSSRIPQLLARCTYMRGSLVRHTPHMRVCVCGWVGVCVSKYISRCPKDPYGLF